MGAPEQPIKDPGDVGRRVAHRRGELGLTREELAVEAGMAPGYLAYLEQHPAHISGTALIRLAHALHTTPSQLLGGGRDLPPGRSAAAPQPTLHALDESECWGLLADRGIGRIAVVGENGPEVYPVNYAVIDQRIVFRTAETTHLAGHDDEAVGFEVDHLDDALSEGWSVLVVGRAERVTAPDDVDRLRKHAAVQPWAGGVRDVYVRIQPRRISGRRIRSR